MTPHGRGGSAGDGDQITPLEETTYLGLAPSS